MSYKCWRGVVGLIQPSIRPGGLEDFIRLLPEGIGVIPLFLGIIKEGTEEEFLGVMETVKEKVAEAAKHKVDLIFPAGAPPFVVRGYKGEQTIVRDLEEKHGIPIVTSLMSQVEAMKALGVKRVVGVTYFEDRINRKCASYFSEAGFEVLGMEAISAYAGRVSFSFQEIYALTKKQFLKHKNAQVLYMPGGAWRPSDTQILEEDLQVPVVNGINAKVWAIQKRLFVGQRVKGYGRLLEEMP